MSSSVTRSLLLDDYIVLDSVTGSGELDNLEEIGQKQETRTSVMNGLLVVPRRWVDWVKGPPPPLS